MNTIEIESQTQLLDRLRLVTRFGSNFVTLVGEEGAGKTWLAQRYLEAWASEKNQSLLLCHSAQTDTEHRSTIINQLFRQLRFDPSHSLSETLPAELADSKCDIVIVVDNAEHLSRVILNELCQLVSIANTEPKWMINVVLLSARANLPRLVADHSRGLNHTPLEMDIDGFSDSEKERFLEFMVYKSIVDEDILKVAQRASQTTPPRPGALMALMDSKKKKQVIIRSVIASPLNLVVIVVLLALLLFGGYYWLNSQSTPEQYAEALKEQQAETTGLGTAAINESSVKTPQAGDVLSSKDPLVLEAQEAAREKEVQFDAIDDDTALPPKVSELTVTVADNEDSRKRVIVPDTVVDALIEEQPIDTAIIDNALIDATERALQAEDERQTTSETAVESEQQAEEEAPSVVITFSYARDELRAIPQNYYTLQLGAMNSLDEVQRFIDQHQLDGKVRIYPTIRSDKQWFIITYQDFVTIQDARDAIAQLPQGVQAVGPWAKSMLQVHKEIDAAN